MSAHWCTARRVASSGTTRGTSTTLQQAVLHAGGWWIRDPLQIHWEKQTKHLRIQCICRPTMTDWLTRRWQLVGGLLVFLLAGKVSWPTYFRLTANRHFTLLRPNVSGSAARRTPSCTRARAPLAPHRPWSRRRLRPAGCAASPSSSSALLHFQPPRWSSSRWPRPGALPTARSSRLGSTATRR